MRLRFLGTAAAEGYPDAFCECVNCREARQRGGRSLRRRSSALIDDELLIDLGIDLMAAAQADGLSLARVRYCLQTHEHADHLDPMLLWARSPACSVEGAPRLDYYATAGALAKAAEVLGVSAPARLLDPTVGDRYNLTAHRVEPFESFDVGPYRVQSVRANHDPSHIDALLYVIERDGRCLFYATDTGELTEETWTALAAWGGDGRRIHAVAMDHTWGVRERVEGHMNWEQFTEQIARLRELDLLADGARFFAHHLAHHSNPAHEELVEFATARGYEVAYDGLVVEV
jgi:phosphoribosyl 1,2-cyclic phosphate phosphodiesterase